MLMFKTVKIRNINLNKDVLWTKLLEKCSILGDSLLRKGSQGEGRDQKREKGPAGNNGKDRK